MPRLYSTNTQIILARIEKLTSLVCLRWETGGFQVVGRWVAKSFIQYMQSGLNSSFFHFDIKVEIKDTSYYHCENDFDAVTRKFYTMIVTVTSQKFCDRGLHILQI